MALSASYLWFGSYTGVSIVDKGENIPLADFIRTGFEYLTGTTLSVHIVFKFKSILGSAIIPNVDKGKKLIWSVCIADK